MTTILHSPNTFVSPGECYQCGTNHMVVGRSFVMVGFPNEFIGQVSLCTTCLMTLAIETGLCVSTDKYTILSDENATLSKRNAELTEALEGLSEHVANLASSINSGPSVTSSLPDDLHVVEVVEEPATESDDGDDEDFGIFNVLVANQSGEPDGTERDSKAVNAAIEF